VRRRIESARFRSPVPDAPRTVSTSLEARAMPVPEKQPPAPN
jgi:hypothetical protein